MFNKSYFFNERLHVSSDLAEKVRARWGVVYHAVEALHASETVEHGVGLLQPETAPHQLPVQAPASKREAVHAAQIGSNVFSLEAYSAQRQQTAQEVEAMGQQRQVEQARLNAELARHEGEKENYGQLAA